MEFLHSVHASTDGKKELWSLSNAHLFPSLVIAFPNTFSNGIANQVAREIPDALAIFRRRRFVQEGTAVVMGVSAIATLLTLLGSLAWNRRTSFQKMRER